jgi:Protein of unknown function (DUF1194)
MRQILRRISLPINQPVESTNMNVAFLLASAKAAVTSGVVTLAVSVLTAPSYAAALVPVDLELWLGVDVSPSISSSEFNLQKNGYANAFNSSELQNLIARSTNGVAVGYGYWSSPYLQNVAVNWTLLKTAQDATNFAAAIAATTRPFGGGTYIREAIDFGVNQILTNTFEGTQKTIDISGDGYSDSWPHPARNAAAARGITINGLAIGNQGLVTYYKNNVATANGFVIGTPDILGFEAAIKEKLTREIGDGIVVPPGPVVSTPEPVSGLILGLVGIGLVAFRKQGNRGQSPEA